MENMCRRAFSKHAGVFHEVPDGHRHLNSDVVQPRLTIERYGTKQETAIKIKHTKISSKQELKINIKYLITVTGEERELLFGNDLMVH